MQQIIQANQAINHNSQSLISKMISRYKAYTEGQEEHKMIGIFWVWFLYPVPQLS